MTTKSHSTDTLADESSAPEMISCAELVDFLADYFDGALTTPQRRRFDEHLAVCPQCVAYLESYRETIRLEKAAFAGDTDRVPAKLVEAILAARRQRG